jgi:hypothetical protein
MPPGNALSRPLHVTRKTSKRPNLFIVGAPKAGTTALSEYLRGHPQVFMLRPKEPFYFCSEFTGLPGPRSERAYLELFAQAPESASILGEASAMYLYSERAAGRIREFAPSGRIVVMLRSPIELVQSFHGQQYYGLSEDVEDLESAWALQDARARGESLPPRVREPSFLQYRRVARLGEQVERLLEVFPREQVHFVFFEDFCADTRREYERVLGFLGLEPNPRRDFERVNPARRNRIGWLASALHRPPRWISAAAARLKRIAGLRGVGFLDSIRRANEAPWVRSELSAEFRWTLAEEFRQDTELLSRLVGRDLTTWLEGDRVGPVD